MPGVSWPVNLPEVVAKALQAFVEAAQGTLGPDLRSIVLFGSAAEGRLRPTSDVNMIVVLRALDATRADRLREPLRRAHTAANLEAMFLLEREIPTAAEAFAVKFADIRRRRHVVWGDDPFQELSVSRDAELARTKQVLWNLALRLRGRYLLSSTHKEQAILAIADAAGPLRAVAGALLELEGQPPAPSPREALAAVVARLNPPLAPTDRSWSEVLVHLSEAREGRGLPEGLAASTLWRLADLARLLAEHAASLR
jgi:predicted nucleotidyltransferase